MSGSRRDGAEIKVGLTQFPLTNAIVLTDHKTQGLTLDHLMLGQTPKINTAITDGFTSFSHASETLTASISSLLSPLTSLSIKKETTSQPNYSICKLLK